ncbi:helix-turn-helix transcriptional regulator [Sphaerisporangium sp. NPDC051017]|uniref:helix-turn-helix domain-containing protein n=1 Tax=Sphaerisporangium sp. NPDC051017 TaxID=3154636 RepID=UPI0034256DE2
MKQPGSPTVRRRRLASDLRRMREKAELTMEQVAERLGWSITKVSRIETSKVGVTVKDVGLLLDLFELTPSRRAEILTLARDAQKKGWWEGYGDLPTEYATYIGLEAATTSIRSFAPEIVPGLLQTEDYARAVIRAALITSPPGEIERRVEVRVARQARLSQQDPLRLWSVLDEATLRRLVGGPDVMRAQLRHLADLTETPNITLQVLPFAVGAHAATSGAFSIFEFPEQADADVVFLENLTGSLYVEKETDVYRYTLAFDHLRAKARDPDESRRFITEMIGLTAES